MIPIIKELKLENLKKEKNKKGWLGFLINQSEVKLTENQITQVEKEVQDFIKTLNTETNLTFKADLKLEKLSIFLKY